MGQGLEAPPPKQLSICMPESEPSLCFPGMHPESVVKLSVWAAGMHLFVQFWKRILCSILLIWFYELHISDHSMLQQMLLTHKGHPLG